MLTGPALTAAIANAPTRPLRETYFRATPTAHVTDPLAKNRPLPLSRNRYNVRGGARVLYIAEDMFTAIYELQAFNWPPKPISLVPVRFELNSVLDLTDGKVHKLLQTTQTELEYNFRSVPLAGPPTATQELGEVCAASGRIDGLLFFSCALPPGAPPKVNMAVLEAGVANLGSVVEAEDPLNNVRHRL